MGRPSTCNFSPSGVPHGEALIGRVRAEAMREFRAANDQLAGELGPALSSLLRSPVEVRLSGADPSTYGEFLGRLQVPTFFNVLQAAGLDDVLMLDIEPPVLFPMIDCMLGGGRADEPPPCRPLTDVELSLSARIVRVFLERIEAAWQTIKPVRLAVAGVTANPILLRVLPSDEGVLRVGLRLSIGDAHGMARLCVPLRAIERLGRRTAEAAGAPGKPGMNGGASADSGSYSEISVTWATTPITVEEMAALRVGDIIATETDADRPVIVSVGGEPRFLGKAGACGGRRAVRITGIVEAADQTPA